MINSIGRQHWAIKVRETKDFHFLVWDAVRKRKPLRPLEHAQLFLVRHSASEPDFDGLTSGFKSTIDGLVKAGVLVDDKPSNISPVYRWEKAKRKQGYITVRVEEVS
jgi:hypothetical protein